MAHSLKVELLKDLLSAPKRRKAFEKTELNKIILKQLEEDDGLIKILVMNDLYCKIPAELVDNVVQYIMRIESE